MLSVTEIFQCTSIQQHEPNVCACGVSSALVHRMAAASGRKIVSVYSPVYELIV